MKRVGPGVDLSVPLHHVGYGFFVQAVSDGEERGVRVLCTNGELPLADGSNLRFDATFSMECWASADKAARELPTEPVPVPEHLAARHE